MLSCSVVSDSLRSHGLYSARSSVYGDAPGYSTRVGCHALLQGIFPTQGSNPGVPHYRRIPYCLSHQGSPSLLYIVGSLSLLQGIFPAQELNLGLLHCRQIFYQLSYQGRPCKVFTTTLIFQMRMKVQKHSIKYQRNTVNEYWVWMLI